MTPNRQRKSKKIHWLQDFVKSIMDDSLPCTIAEEQLPFPPDNYTHTPPLTHPVHTHYPKHFYAPGTPHYTLSVSDPDSKTWTTTQDNWLLQSQLQDDDLFVKDVDCHLELQEGSFLPMGPQEVSPRHTKIHFVNFTRASIRRVYTLFSRRFVVRGALSILFIFIAAGTFIAMVPAGYHKDLDVHMPFSFHTISVHRNDTALIEGLAATATAVTVDGYDPGGGHTYADVLTIPKAISIPAADYGSLNHFFYGQCTYWANMRYHQETGHWIPWLGNAYQWAYQAPAYGWTLSATPNPHGLSIMVFSPYAEGAGAYGHVAVVESINNDGSVTTSNWNWGGAWATLTYRTFYPGPGVSFIWYPN